MEPPPITPQNQKKGSSQRPLTPKQKYPDQYESAKMYMEYFEDKHISGGEFEDPSGGLLDITDVLHQPTLEQIAIVLKNNASIGTSEDEWEDIENEWEDNEKVARGLGKNFPQLIKQTPEALQFFNSPPIRRKNRTEEPSQPGGLTPGIPTCQFCGGSMKKTVESSGNCGGLVIALICFCAGVIIFFAIPMLGWVLGPVICLGALFMGGHSTKVWKCTECDSVVNRSDSNSGFGCLFLVLLIISVLLIYRGCMQETKAKQEPETKAKQKPETKPEQEPETKPEQKPETKPEQKPETKPLTTLPYKSRILDSIEGIRLPCTVRVMTFQSVNLLNAAGKEISLPENTIITINKRSDNGTLTMQINGALYVGNETRLSKKIMLR
jgi:hypothetical protein